MLTQKVKSEKLLDKSHENLEMKNNFSRSVELSEKLYVSMGDID